MRSSTKTRSTSSRSPPIRPADDGAGRRPWSRRWFSLAAGAAVGGYFLGDSTGADLDAARAEGAVAGKKAGTAQGARAGYSDGLRQGQEQGYESTYAGAYRDAYAQAYEAADLTPPKEIEVRAMTLSRPLAIAGMGLFVVLLGALGYLVTAVRRS